MSLKRTLAAALLCLCTALAVAPAAAFAADGDVIYVGGEALTGSADSPAYAVTTAGGAVETSGADEGTYAIKWDGSTLTLRDANIAQGFCTVDKDDGIYGAVWCETDFSIKLVGENTIEGPDSDSVLPAEAHVSAGIYAEESLDIGGAGVLSVTGGAVEAADRIAHSCGIIAYGTLTTASGTVEAYGGKTTGGYSVSYGIGADKITVNAGAVQAYGGAATGELATSYGIGALSVTINSGTVEAVGDEAIATGDREDGYARSAGIFSRDNLTITGGEVAARGGYGHDRGSGSNSYSYGFEAKGSVLIENATVFAQGDEASCSAGVFASEESIVIESGTVEAIGGRAIVSSAGIRAENGDVTINGGDIYAAVDLTESEVADGIYAYGDIAINGGTVEAMGCSESMDGVEPDSSSGIFSETGDIAIAGDGTVVNATSGYASGGVAAIATQAGTIVVQGGTVQADGASCYDPWLDPEGGFIGYGLCALQGPDGIGGGSIVISGGSVAAVGSTESIFYDGELTARPTNGKIAVSVQDDWMLDQETFEVLWSAMAESALEIEGSPFAKETVIDRALTKGKLYFLAVGVADGTVNPEEPTGPIVPEDQTGPTEPTEPVDSDKQPGDANKSTSTPRTGDGSNPIVWLVVLLAAATAATAAAAYGCRRKGGR